MSTPNATCSTCRFHHAFALANKREVHQCRLRAPTIHPVDGQTVWPLTQPTFSCGEHKPVPESDEQRRARREAYEREERERVRSLKNRELGGL